MQILKKGLVGIGVGAVSLTALYYSALFLIPQVVDLNKYKDNFSTAIEKETGLKFNCENIEFQKGINPYLCINLHHAIVLYPDDSVFLKIRDIDLKIKMLPLILKQIVIKDMKFNRPVINITLYKDFSTSVEKYVNINKPLNTNGFRLKRLINDTVCDNYKIKYKDESINKTFYFEGEKLVLKDFDANSTAHVILKGALFENKTEYIKYDIDVISPLDLINKRFTFSPFKTIFETNAKGEINGHLKFEQDKKINGNLEIKNLSLKLNNITSENNNAFIEFKGDVTEINSDIHTSKNDSAKVNAKFSNGTKKFLDVTTNAKNINLENLFIIVSSLSKILNVKNPVNDISANGLLNADFSINSDFKKLKSKGTAKIINAELKHKAIQYPIDKINAEISFENNNIRIENAQAYVNKTPVKIEGSINNDVTVDIQAYSDNLNIKTLISLFANKENIPFNINSGILNFKSHITGKPDKALKTHSNITVMNLKLTDTKTKTPINIQKLNTDIDTLSNKYSGKVKIENISATYNKQNINADVLNIDFDEKNINIPQNTVTIINSPIKIKGEIKDYLNKTATLNIDFNGDINSADLAKIVAQYVKAQHKAIGKLNTTGKITANEKEQNIKLKLKANSENYLSYAVIKEILKKPSVFDLDCNFADKTININNISLTEDVNGSKSQPKKIFIVNGKLLLEKIPEFKNIRIYIPNIISLSTNYYGGENASVSGDIYINGNTKSAELSGNAKIHKYDIKKFQTYINNADLSFNKDNIRLIAPDVLIGNSSFNAIADIQPLLNDKNIIINNMQIQSANLNVNSLLPVINEKDKFLKNTNINIKKGSASINNFQFEDIKARDISSDFSVEKNILKISNINASAYTGNVSGKIDYDLNHDMLNVDMTGKGIDVKTSLYDLCKYQDNLSGRADFETKVSFVVGSYNSFLKSLTGSMNFDSYNGGMGTLGKFEYYLYAKNLMYHGLLNATLNRVADTFKHDKTEQYKKANGKIIFQNGYIITNGIKTTGKDMSLYIKGRHNMFTNESNLDIYGRISDEIKSRLGSFADVSISEMVNGTKSKKDISYTIISDELMKEIPQLASNTSGKTNTFKVNVLGDIKSLNAISSFVWAISYEPAVQNENATEKLPDFSDMLNIDSQEQ